MNELQTIGSQRIYELRDAVQSLCNQLDKGRDLPEDFGDGELNLIFNTTGVCQNLSSAMFEPRRFGSGLPDHGRAG
jgi:hypothetical protein